MGSMARNKGKRGERMVIDELQPIVNKVFSEAGVTGSDIPILQRNTLQSDRGGHDIVGLHWFAPEVKNCETFNLKAWWQQTKSQAKKHQVPVLFYKKNNAAFRVRMYGKLDVKDALQVSALVDISMESFLIWFAKRLEIEVQKLYGN